MTTNLSRREFFKLSSFALASMPWVRLRAQNAQHSVSPSGDKSQSSAWPPSGIVSNRAAPLEWLDHLAPVSFEGATWGVPWAQGTVSRGDRFELRGAGSTLAVQSWPLAYWPDGSLKWTAHAVPPDAPGRGDTRATMPADLQLVAASGNATPEDTVSAWLTDDGHTIQIDTGVLRCRIVRGADTVFEMCDRPGHASVRNGRLVVLAESSQTDESNSGHGATPPGSPGLDPTPSRASSSHESFDDETAVLVRTRWLSFIDSVSIEQQGAQRVVVRLDGRHRRSGSSDTAGATGTSGTSNASGASGRSDASIASPAAGDDTLLPFVLRLYFYRNSASVRGVHSFVYDCDPTRLSIRGIGVRFDAPLAGELHDRHVRFVGANGGVFAEAVRTLSGLRRDAGPGIAAAQVAGLATPPTDSFVKEVRDDLRFVPAFGSYRLYQSGPDSFTIDKRTGRAQAWVHAVNGTRAAGTGFLGTPDGGVAFGVRDFWQRFPSQLDIDDAQTDRATVTLWFWSPSAPGMDLRPYHDGMGERSYALQRDALDITYEDYEPGFATPYGVARTTEFEWQLTDTTPSASTLVEYSQRIATPPRIVPSRRHMYEAHAFSSYWAPKEVIMGYFPGDTVNAVADIEGQAVALDGGLDWTFNFYRDQIAQRRWYGFWDYGDVMHTYDAQRHVWRYDVGGFAWDNGELSTDIWLWHQYLYSGHADLFRVAEAMTRHRSEVDVHHIGPFSPLGSRHDVQHWGDSAKQLRVSSVANLRFYYYLSADERVGDLIREQRDAVERLREVLPGRKIGEQFPTADPEHHANVSFGTDWGAVAAAWFAEWERTGSVAYRDKLVASMESIAAQPQGFFTGGGILDLRTGRFEIGTSNALSVSHLSAMFGLPEICSELIRTIDVPPFREAWLRYCVLYSASAEEQQKALGESLGKLNLNQAHARLLAFAAAQCSDPVLLKQAWSQFLAGKAGLKPSDQIIERVHVPDVLDDIDEAPRISTNAAAQWGLGAIGLLAASRAFSRTPRLHYAGYTWRVEAEEASHPTGSPSKPVAYVEENALVLDTPKGLTVWLEQPLEAHYEITYKRRVVDAGGAYDRVSDFNQFWLAHASPDGHNAVFGRDGSLAAYDDLLLYYAGIGGNSNTTTRFRRYDGTTKRPLLKEYLDTARLLQGNHTYEVRTVVDGRGTRVYLDGTLLFEDAGPVPLRGFFAFRTTQSHQILSDFQIRPLE